MGLEISSCMGDEIPIRSTVRLHCREFLRKIAQSKGVRVYAASINRGHMHMLIGISPNLSVSKAMQYLKGKSHISCCQSTAS